MSKYGKEDREQSPKWNKRKESEGRSGWADEDGDGVQMGNSYITPALYYQSENLLNKIKVVSETTGWEAFSEHYIMVCRGWITSSKSRLQTEN